MDHSNPLLGKWNTPFGVPPFNEIKISHFIPAIREAINRARAEIDAIVRNNEPPTFTNTIEALEQSGEALGKISHILFNLNSAETSSELQAVAMEASPLLTNHANDITLNEELFLRIEQVCRSRKYTVYTAEQQMLIEKTYRSFILGGAGLHGNNRERYRAISSELATLTLKFTENVLAETNAFILHITSEEELAGIPEGIREAAAAEAAARNMEGWAFTLHAPSFIPFMQYSEKPELREKLFKAQASRSFRNNEYDNRRIVIKLTNLRLELARLLGYPDYASLVLEDRMAGSTEGVQVFLRKLLAASLPAATSDFNRIAGLAANEGLGRDIMRWDWSFYAERLKRKLFDIDDEVLRPYFKLENVIDAVFGLANRLYGVEFNRAEGVPVYHPDVVAYEITEKGRHLALLYLDFHPRSGKNGGAWMTTFRDQHRKEGRDIRPVVSLVMNFTKPSPSNPSLLTHNELTTLLHEFGHALHAVFSENTYELLSGTNVALDFVELPSQIMENWAWEKEWLDTWARHYQTEAKIPALLLEKLRELSVFNEGYACLRQLSFALLDMAWHTINNECKRDVDSFERNAMLFTELFPHIEGTNTSVAFSHLFGGGYSAGYYGYKWAEVLEADAYSLFKETGIFNRDTATAFRNNILAKGASVKPSILYRQFRGREPSMEPFFERSGFIR